MYKGKIYSLLFVLVGLLISTAVLADDDDIAQNVRPYLNSEEDVCIFLQTPDRATYTFYGYGGTGTYQREKPATAPSGDNFSLVGQQSDGLYLYKWVRPTGATGLPASFTLTKNNSADDEREFELGFSNHGIYVAERATNVKDEVTATDISNATSSLITKEAHTIYFVTPNQQTYYLWAWGTRTVDKGDGTTSEVNVDGSEYSIKKDDNGNLLTDDNGNYIAGGSFPGDQLTYVGQQDDGKYIYKWTQQVNITSNPTPSKYIISRSKSDKVPGMEEVAYDENKYYVETVTRDVNGLNVYQYATAHVIPTSQEESLTPLAIVNASDEISVFLESGVGPTNGSSPYHIWPWNDTYGGEYFANGNGAKGNGNDYPGETFTYIGTFKDANSNDRYLYKWTEDPHLHYMPTSMIINKGADETLNDHKLVNPSTNGTDFGFTNHGYYVVSDDNTKASYKNLVTRQADGTFETSRTTYGQRVIYELNLGSFTNAAEGQKITAATNRLDYLKDLGVDVIYLMPIYQRDKGASPYASTDLTKVNSRYGSLDELKNFVTQAHLHGMDVWLDFAANHVATNNIWAVKDVDANGNPQNNYHPEYFKKDTNGNFVNPVSGSQTYNDVYQLDYDVLVDEKDANGNLIKDEEGTVQQSNPAGEAIKKILLYWVDELNIDGYRFDYVSSPTIPDAFWQGITQALKKEKSSLQFLAERDFSQGHTPDPSYFDYDYAWDFNADLRRLRDKKQANEGTNGNILDITRYRVDQFDQSNIDPMVYLTNHDMNWNEYPKSLKDTWGDNRYPMTVYEFTMPGMPLIYNGQEQDGTIALNYFNDDVIDWANTNDYHMRGLIQELSYLKHTNNALNDGYSKDQRGELKILNPYDTRILAYERIKGDKHVLVVLNFSDGDAQQSGQPVVTTQIAGATPGQWKKVIEGNGSSLITSYEDKDDKSNLVQVDNTWTCERIPAHGYQIYTYTGPKKPDVNPGLYFVADDSKDNPTKHVMGKQYDGTYQFIMEASEFDALNTKPGAAAPDDNTLTFKLQEYYDWKGTTCKTDQCLGAYETDASFGEGDGKALSFEARKDGDIDADDAANNKKKNNKYFNMVKGAGVSNPDDILRYIFTFTPGTKENEDGTTETTMDYGTLTLKIVKKGDVTDGWYLMTPSNIESNELTERLKWRFKAESEDPDAVNDNYLRYNIHDDKTLLSSFTIDDDKFYRYMPDDMRSLNAIQFRIQRVENQEENKNTNGEVTQVQPKTDDEAANYTFDATVDPNKWYQNSYWEPYSKDKPYYFILKKQNNVDKYIIQIWRNSSYTSVKVYYIYRYDYTGSKIDDIAASGEDVYLYNVDAHRFLYTGNLWGTQASLLYKDLGTRLNIQPGVTGENKDYKMIRTKFENNTTVENGHMLGIDDFSYKAIANPQSDNDKFLNLDSANIFCDRDNGNRWIIERADNDEYGNTYLLRLFDKKDNRYHMMLAAHDDDIHSNKNTNVIYIAQQMTTVTATDDDDKITKVTTTAPGIVRQNDPDRQNGKTIYYYGWIGDRGYLQYKYDAPKDGTYEVTVDYMSRYDNSLQGYRSLSVKVGDQNISQQSVNTGSWNKTADAHSMTYTFKMKKGENVITFGDQGGVKAPNILSFTIRLTRPDDLSYARWQFVTYNDLMEKLRSENAEVYGGTHADATFLMKDQGFTRYIQNTWDTDNGTKDVVYNIKYTSQKDKDDKNLPQSYSTNNSTVTVAKNKIGDNRENGMYWNGHINGTGLVYQDVDVPIYGVYQFDAYGFWHGSTTKMFYQYATSFDDNGNATGWSDMYVGQPLKENGNGYNATLADSRQNDINTGEEFYKESVLDIGEKKYLNTQYAYVPEDLAAHTASNNGNYRLRIGFFKTAADVDHGDADKDYTAVDDVHLHYNGKSPFTLKENWTQSELNTNTSNETRSSVLVWLKRKFTINVWNTLVLPLPVSVSTLQDIFGPDVQVATPYGLDDNDPYLIRFTDVNLSNTNGGIALEAGKYYIIKPTKLNGNTSVINVNSSTGEVLEDGISDTDSQGTAFYYLGNFDLREGTTNKANLTSGCAPLEIGDDFHETSKNHPEHNSIKFIGNYNAVDITATSKEDQAKGLYRYLFSTSGNAVRLTNVSKTRHINGYRFYIEDYTKSQTGTAKQYEVKMASLDDDLYSILDSYNKKGSATGIEDVSAHNDKNNYHGDNYVYDLSGRRVAEGGKLENLPRGVYIFNGKKFIKD